MHRGSRTTSSSRNISHGAVPRNLPSFRARAIASQRLRSSDVGRTSHAMHDELNRALITKSALHLGIAAARRVASVSPNRRSESQDSPFPPHSVAHAARDGMATRRAPRMRYFNRRQCPPKHTRPESRSASARQCHCSRMLFRSFRRYLRRVHSSATNTMPLNFESRLVMSSPFDNSSRALIAAELTSESTNHSPASKSSTTVFAGNPEFAIRLPNSRNEDCRNVFLQNCANHCPVAVGVFLHDNPDFSFGRFACGVLQIARFKGDRCRYLDRGSERRPFQPDTGVASVCNPDPYWLLQALPVGDAKRASNERTGRRSVIIGAGLGNHNFFLGRWALFSVRGSYGPIVSRFSNHLN